MEQDASKSTIATVIKYLYYYIVSIVALFMIVFSVVDMVNLGLRTFIFPKADHNFYGYYGTCPVAVDASSTKPDPNCLSREQQEKIDRDNSVSQKQKDLVRDISFILVAVPLFAYHWRIIRRRDM